MEDKVQRYSLQVASDSNGIAAMAKAESGVWVRYEALEKCAEEARKFQSDNAALRLMLEEVLSAGDEELDIAILSAKEFMAARFPSGS